VDEGEGEMSLSERIRSNAEAAPWVIAEIQRIELELAAVKSAAQHACEIARQANEQMQADREAVYTVLPTLGQLDFALTRALNASTKDKAIHIMDEFARMLARDLEVTQARLHDVSVENTKLLADKGRLDWLLKNWPFLPMGINTSRAAIDAVKGVAK
jgi:hypothetical protein